MKNLKLSNRYAKSLYDFAQEKGEVEQVYQDLKMIKQALNENETEFRSLLESARKELL